MAHHVLCEKIEEIKENVSFSFMGDLHQQQRAIFPFVAICERKLGSSKGLFRFSLKQLANIKIETILNTTKGALFRFNLQLEYYISRILKSFFNFGSKITHLFMQSIRCHKGHSWLNICCYKVFTEKRKLIGNNFEASRCRTLHKKDFFSKCNQICGKLRIW